jgi:hypothetical protein
MQLTVKFVSWSRPLERIVALNVDSSVFSNVGVGGGDLKVSFVIIMVTFSMVFIAEVVARVYSRKDFDFFS